MPPEEPPVFRARVVDAGGAPPVPVDLEVKARIIDAKRDNAAGTVIVTVAAGQNHGIGLDWIGTIVDEDDKPLGTFTIIEVKERTTIGASALDPKKLEAKLVRLVTPPRSDRD